jgi:predicted dehydrogenase
MLDKEGKNIDAVVITTPDHFHAYAAIGCMERGKHIYVEKPLTHSIWEARFLAEAAVKYKVATQMGNQGYSSDGERIASEIIWSGEIGNVTEVHAWTNRPIWPQGITELPPEEKVPDTLDWDMWLGPASVRPYSSAYLPFNWRAWFDFGCGALGDIACHVLGAANMGLRLGAPTSVEVVKQEGKNPYTFPKRSQIHIQFPARGPMPPVKIFWYDGVEEERAYQPPGIPASEPLFGGPDSFGAGGGNVRHAPGKGTWAGSGSGSEFPNPRSPDDQHPKPNGGPGRGCFCWR